MYNVYEFEMTLYSGDVADVWFFWSQKILLNTRNQMHIVPQYIICCQLFTEYGKLASGKRNRKQSKPFQKLLFLIRDWTSLDEAPNGTKGGQMFLNKIFEEVSFFANKYLSVLPLLF